MICLSRYVSNSSSLMLALERNCAVTPGTVKVPNRSVDMVVSRVTFRQIITDTLPVALEIRVS